MEAVWMILKHGLWQSREFERGTVERRLFPLTRNHYNIIGMTRIRNEEEIIADTIRHVSRFVDAIIVFDDCSTDSTVSIVKSFGSVIEVIRNREWKTTRIEEETAHRQILLDSARKYQPHWLFYFDADERFDITKEEIENIPDSIDGVRIRLFDAYMTPEDHSAIRQNQPLWGGRKYFGPEYRDILMLFRNRADISFQGLDAREPVGCNCVITKFFCQHYGKALSEPQWEDTCDYYARYFPEPYHTKWLQRKGKSIHSQSDFGNALLCWDDVKTKGFKL